MNILQLTAPSKTEVNKDTKSQQLSDNNAVTGDTPTFYAGFSGDSKPVEKDVSTEKNGGIFSSIIDTIGTFSDFKLPNIGFNVDWANLPIGRNDEMQSKLSSKLGLPASEQARTLVDDYVNQFQNARLAAEWEQQRNSQRSNPQFGNIHPRMPPPVKLSDFITPPVSKRVIFPANPNTETRKLSSVSFGEPLPGSHISKSSGTPFVLGQSVTKQNNINNVQHIINPIDGRTNTANLPHKKYSNSVYFNDKIDKNSVRWSRPEVLIPNSGVHLYQPREQFKPIHPNFPNNPIQIINPPNAALNYSFKSVEKIDTFIDDESQGVPNIDFPHNIIRNINPIQEVSSPTQIIGNINPIQEVSSPTQIPIPDLSQIFDFKFDAVSQNSDKDEVNSLPRIKNSTFTNKSDSTNFSNRADHKDGQPNLPIDPFHEVKGYNHNDNQSNLPVDPSHEVKVDNHNDDQSNLPMDPSHEVKLGNHNEPLINHNMNIDAVSGIIPDPEVYASVSKTSDTYYDDFVEQVETILNKNDFNSVDQTVIKTESDPKTDKNDTINSVDQTVMETESDSITEKESLSHVTFKTIVDDTNSDIVSKVTDEIMSRTTTSASMLFTMTHRPPTIYGNINAVNKHEFESEMNTNDESDPTAFSGKNVNTVTEPIDSHSNKILPHVSLLSDTIQNQKVEGNPLKDHINVYGSYSPLLEKYKQESFPTVPPDQLEERLLHKHFDDNIRYGFISGTDVKNENVMGLNHKTNTVSQSRLEYDYEEQNSGRPHIEEIYPSSDTIPPYSIADDYTQSQSTDHNKYSSSAHAVPETNDPMTAHVSLQQLIPNEFEIFPKESTKTSVSMDISRTGHHVSGNKNSFTELNTKGPTQKYHSENSEFYSENSTIYDEKGIINVTSLDKNESTSNYEVSRKTGIDWYYENYNKLETTTVSIPQKESSEKLIGASIENNEIIFVARNESKEKLVGGTGNTASSHICYELMYMLTLILTIAKFNENT